MAIPIILGRIFFTFKIGIMFINQNILSFSKIFVHLARYMPIPCQGSDLSLAASNKQVIFTLLQHFQNMYQLSHAATI